jgi:LPS-assembly lipoprotein
MPAFLILPPLARVTLITAALALVACGFQPIHGERGRAGAGGLPPVSVAPIPERTGQLVRAELTRRLDSARGQGQRLALDVRLAEAIGETSFRADETATRRNITLTATYRLRDPATRRVVLDGQVRSTNSANILDQPFATEVATRDARERGAIDLAQKIFRDIASKLTTR